MPVVLDTNVLISGALFPNSVPGKSFDQVQLVDSLLFSEASFAELQSVLNRPKFLPYLDIGRRDRFLRRCLQASAFVKIERTFKACRDPKDDKFLDVAVNGRANIIVTGDSDLLVLDSFEGIPIVTPAAYLGRSTP